VMVEEELSVAPAPLMFNARLVAVPLIDTVAPALGLVFPVTGRLKLPPLSVAPDWTVRLLKFGRGVEPAVIVQTDPVLMTISWPATGIPRLHAAPVPQVVLAGPKKLVAE